MYGLRAEDTRSEILQSKCCRRSLAGRMHSAEGWPSSSSKPPLSTEPPKQGREICLDLFLTVIDTPDG